MYGLVNKAIEDLICGQFGVDTWEVVKRKAGVEAEAFVSMESYPDDVTYNLVAAASEVLALSPEDVLKAFGEHWVLYTAREGYGELLKMSGKSFKEFLHHVDDLHAHVGLSFPNLMPPSFKCTENGDGSVALHYYSSRPGLAPMVIGLLNGLGKMFKTEIDVSQTMSREDGDDHDVFLVKFTEA